MSALTRERPVARSRELTALLAMSMALSALGIDLMLPGFGAIRRGLGLPPDSTAVTGLVTSYFVGLAAGQLIYGPLADRFGRRSSLYLSYGIYAAGALAAALSPTLALLLVSRFVWGLGAAGQRVITTAVVRDLYEGEAMSRALSLILAVFLLVPVLAPTLGAGIVAVASWRWMFVLCVVAVALMALWAVRLPETLRDEHRRPLRFRPVTQAARVVVSHRGTVGYTLAITALFGALAGYLGSAEAIFGQTFNRPGSFPLYFGGLAAIMAATMLISARIVGRVGTRRLAHTVLAIFPVAAGALAGVALVTDGRPPLALFLIGMAVMTACHGVLLPNLNTLAMGPMAEVAGTASSVIGAVQLGGGALVGALLDRAFDGTVRPMALGYFATAVLALASVAWGQRGRLSRQPSAVVATDAITSSGA
ncbi:MAG TPA: multidrug effflux MFS transporter [Egibacteraceae bacterium]|nr:multidrug effflux MFS transporter [Egibacteraceae bacterium]